MMCSRCLAVDCKVHKGIAEPVFAERLGVEANPHSHPLHSCGVESFIEHGVLVGLS
jgi:hypothetical protein